MTLSPATSLTPDHLTTSAQHGGASRRGPHRLASTSCERLWALRSSYGVVAKYDPPLRLQGTLIHTCLAYYYAERMRPQPSWFVERPIDVALAKDGEGHPDLIRNAVAVFEAFKQRVAGDTWQPICAEEEFEATIGEIDPEGSDTSLNSEVVTCRTDLVIEVNGELWIVDHKSTGGSYNSDRLAVWKDDGEYKMNWQIMMNLHILRTPRNVARLGGRTVRGFIIQRLKQRPPYDFDRHPVHVPALAYQATPRTARNFVAKEREILQKIERGESPTPNFGACWGRYGACDYHDLCAASSKSEQQAILDTAYKTLK